MFTHRVQMSLRAHSYVPLSRRIESTIMPLLRLQKGFMRGVIIIVSERSTATEDTYWNTKEEAKTYNSFSLS